jgi:hypothetical protein
MINPPLMNEDPSIHEYLYQLSMQTIESSHPYLVIKSASAVNLDRLPDINPHKSARKQVPSSPSSG